MYLPIHSIALSILIDIANLLAVIAHVAVRGIRQHFLVAAGGNKYTLVFLQAVRVGDGLGLDRV